MLWKTVVPSHDSMCVVLGVDDMDGSESSGGQRLNDSQRATSLAGRTAHDAEEMLKVMEIKHKYKLVHLSYCS